MQDPRNAGHLNDLTVFQNGGTANTIATKVKHGRIDGDIENIAIGLYAAHSTGASDAAAG
ncbi:hypothetical protein A162_14110 [Vibrio tasmaniensis 1F-155]|nr:hypothetical protein A162_14110 [Vibrio tasmaniensis 1F-155]